MKKKFNFKKSLLITFTVFTAMSCTKSDVSGPPRSNKNVVDIVAADNNLSFLEEALKKTDLESILKTRSVYYTLLAPSNKAFETFLKTNDYEDLSKVPVETLKQLLLNHVLQREFLTRDFSNRTGYTKTFADGPIKDSYLSVFVNGAEGIRLNNQSTISVNQRNISASNGTIHVIDEVISFPNVIDFIKADPGFSDLLTALTQATPDTDFESSVTSNTKKTIFAPTDRVFDALLTTNNDWKKIDDIDEALLTKIISHHIINETNMLSSVIEHNMKSSATMEGDSLIFTKNGKLISIEDGKGNRNINIIATDIQAINGILHIIDKVLIPNDKN